MPVSAIHLHRAADEVARAFAVLEDAQRRAAGGLRAGGPEGDQQRAHVLALVAEADAGLYDARLAMDRLLRPANIDGVYAPRPAIALPA